MNTGVVVLAVLLGFAIVAFVLREALARASAKGSELKGALELLSAQSSTLLTGLSKDFDQRSTNFQRSVDERIYALQVQWQDQNRTIGDRLKDSGDAVRSVSESLGKLAETAKKIEEQGANVLRLEDLLRPQKVRGNLGQTLMVEALRQALPESAFKAPYRFPDGLEVDAAVFLGNRIVPIDSKFPLENYRRAREDPDEAARSRARRQFVSDVKKHVDAISSKYIRPGDGTYEFALLYIPAEAVYAEILSDSEEGSMVDYALRASVVPVSPHLLYAYLHTIALGLRGLEMNTRAQEVLGRLADLSRELTALEAPFAVLGRHLGNAQNKYHEANESLGRLHLRLERIGGAQGALEETPIVTVKVDGEEAEAEVEGHGIPRGHEIELMASLRASVERAKEREAGSLSDAADSNVPVTTEQPPLWPVSRSG